MDGGDVNATRWSYFRRELPSRFNVYALLLGVAVCLAIAARAQSPAIVLVVPAVVAALSVFHGVYLRRRPRIHIPGFLWDDWLARVHAEEVDLESSGFEELYEHLAARDQDRMVLHELFSPSFIVWLTEHPLRPGFECKAGELVVFIPEHEGNAGRLTLFHEAAREVGRRVIAAVDAARSATPAA